MAAAAETRTPGGSGPPGVRSFAGRPGQGGEAPQIEAWVTNLVAR